MKKTLTIKKRNLYYYNKNSSSIINGVHGDINGNIHAGLSGDVSDIRGDISGCLWACI